MESGVKKAAAVNQASRNKGLFVPFSASTVADPTDPARGLASVSPRVVRAGFFRGALQQVGKVPRDGAFTLADVRSPTVSVVCECGRCGRYGRASSSCWQTMSGPILITVGNLLRKTHNRLPLRRRRSTRHEAMAYTPNGSDQFALPQRPRLGAGDEFNLRAQTPTSFEGFSELNSSTRTSPRRKTMPSSRSKNRCNSGNPQ
jgi:hypothetical protein